MRIKVSLTIDIDAEAWELNYGIGDRPALRADVKDYVTNGITEHLRELGLLIERKDDHA